MHGTPILNVYDIRELTASFYNAYNASSYPEILTKTNRPYDVIVFETHYDYYVCVPFRTYLNHNQGFHFYPNPLPNGENPGLDYSETIIVKEDKYIGLSTLIDSKQMALFNKNIAIIQQEVYEYLQGYINHINGTQVMHPSQFKRKYQYSTLKYFHLELGI